MSKAVPFIVSSATGKALLGGAQRILSKLKADIQLQPTSADKVQCASHILAEPLDLPSLTEVSNKFYLNSIVTTARGAGWYPGTIYPTVETTLVRNLYGAINPSFGLTSRGASSGGALVTASGNTLAPTLAELEKETDRTIRTFFFNEARDSLLDSLRLATALAIAKKADRSLVGVAHKPLGDGLTSPFDSLLVQLVKSESDARADELRSNSITLEAQAVGHIWPKLVVFPESIAVVVAPTTDYGVQVEQLLIGIAGGGGMVSQRLQSLKGEIVVHTSANSAQDGNPTGSILSLAELLKGLGFEKEANALVDALTKTYTTDKAFPKELPSGTLGTDAFVDAVLKNI